MGDIADMMIDGDMCQGCGDLFIESFGFPAFCIYCQKENECDLFGEKIITDQNETLCSVCGKGFKKLNHLKQHLKDKHDHTF